MILFEIQNFSRFPFVFPFVFLQTNFRWRPNYSVQKIIVLKTSRLFFKTYPQSSHAYGFDEKKTLIFSYSVPQNLLFFSTILMRFTEYSYLPSFNSSNGANLENIGTDFANFYLLCLLRPGKGFLEEKLRKLIQK